MNSVGSMFQIKKITQTVLIKCKLEHCFVTYSLAAPHTQNGNFLSLKKNCWAKDLKAMQFILWSFIKDHVSPQLNDFPELKHIIQKSIAVITPDLLTEVRENLDYLRLYVRRITKGTITKGTHVEHLIKKSSLSSI